MFEELAQTPVTVSARSLVAQAVAELHLGRRDEASAALEDALRREPACADALADMLVLQVGAGGDALEWTQYVFYC